MLKIGDFSKLSRISIRMLRHYDGIGLLVPMSIDEASGYRYYSEDQLSIAGRILSLKDMGFELSVIKEIIESYEEPETLARFLTIQKEETKAEIEKTSKRLLLLDNAIKRLREDDTAMKYNVILKTLPERCVASVRDIIPSYDKESILWNRLMKETASMSLQPAENCMSMAIFHDDGYKENDVDVEINATVKGIYENTENVVFKTVPEITYASSTYKGCYDQLTEVNKSVARWVTDNGYEFDGAMFCIYHVSPAQTQNPEEFVTEVCYPVRKR